MIALSNRPSGDGAGEAGGRRKAAGRL